MSRLDYVIRRAIITAVLIYIVASALFLFFRAMPGDYATLLMGSGVSGQEAAAIRAKWGLDDPLHVQYFQYIGNIFTGELGTSHVARQPVWQYVKPALMNSIILVTPAIFTAYILGTIYGALMGVKRDSLLEKYGIIPPTVIGAVPSFYVGMVMILIFSAQLGLFPSQGMVSVSTYNELGENITNVDLYMTTDFWHHYVLPFTVIVFAFFYRPALIMRGSVVETAGQAFAYFHRIKGLSTRKQFRHTLRHASLPVVTLFPATMARSISGLVLIEVVFNWPGIGKLLVSAVSARDTPVVQFMFLVIAVWIILGNFMVDLLYGVIDPRISVGGDQEGN